MHSGAEAPIWASALLYRLERKMAARYMAIGRVVRVHGIRGEVKVELMTDYPERFKPGVTVYLGSQTEARLVKIEASRPHQGAVLVKFAGVPDRNAAELLRDQFVLIPEDQAMPLAENENYAHDLIGLSVETTDGEKLGKLTEILYTGANDVYAVAGPNGELLIPALKEVIVNVDLAAGRMVVALLDGLRDNTAKDVDGDEQTDEQTDEETDEQTDEETDELTDEETDEQTDEETDAGARVPS
jgi:16S rRNA processing protein RimM